MAKSETNFWKQLKKNTSGIHWTRIESVATPGIPDLNGFSLGNDGRPSEFWVELKCTRMKKVRLSPYQIQWLTKRSSMGGRAFILVKALVPGAVYIYSGLAARDLHSIGLDFPAIAIYPKPVAWAQLQETLVNFHFPLSIPNSPLAH